MKKHPLFRNIRYIYWTLYREYAIRQIAVKKKRQLEKKFNIKIIEDLDKITDPEFLNNTRWDIISYDSDITWCDKRIDWINRRIKK